MVVPEIAAGCEWVGFGALKPEQQAAWIQAIGSVIALAIAVGIPLIQGLLRRRASHQRARSLALLVITDLEEVQEGMDVFSGQVDQDDRSLIMENTEPFFVVPHALLAHRSDLHLLGPAAKDTIDTVALMFVARRELARAKRIAEHPDRYEYEIYDLDRVRNAAKGISTRVDSAINSIGKMFGDPQRL